MIILIFFKWQLDQIKPLFNVLITLSYLGRISFLVLQDQFDYEKKLLILLPNFVTPPSQIRTFSLNVALLQQLF